MASQLPVVGPTITIAQVKGIEDARSYTKLFNTLANWLPWVTLLLFAAAILLARRRLRTLAISAGCLAGAMLVLALGLNIARSVYLNKTGDYLDPTAAGNIYDTLVRYLRAGIRLILVVAVIVLAVAWLSGQSKPAKGIRGGVLTLWKRIEQQTSTGPTGAFISRYHGALDAAVLVIAAFILVLSTNPSAALVITTVVVAAVLVALIELIRHRAKEPEVGLIRSG